MRKTLLASTAIAFGLAITGPAIAADDTKTDSRIGTDVTTDSDVRKSPGTQHGEDQPTMKSGTDAQMGADTNAKVGADANTQMGSSDSYRSYNDMKDFSGSIAGGFTAEELIGTDVVDANGDEVGEVADILISANNKAETVLVDVGGFLGIGEKRVALGLSELSKQDDVLVTSKTEAELEGMASYSEDGDSWLLDNDRATTAPKAE